MKRFSFLFFGLLLITGCTSITDPYANAPKESSTTWNPLKKNLLVSSEYFDTLVPCDYENKILSLAEMVDIALKNSPLTKASWSEARAQAAKYSQSLSSYFPEFNFVGTYQRERQVFFTQNQFSTTPFYLTTVSPELHVSYTIFDFGERRNTSEAALYSLYYADYMHNQEIQNVLKVVMNEYYNYVYQKHLLKAYEEDLKTSEVVLDAAEKKRDVGVADLSDVSRARAKYLQKKIQTIEQRKTVETSFANLAKNVGLPANVTFQVQDLPEKLSVEPLLENLDQLVTRAQKNRPDFKAASAKVAMSLSNLGKAKAERLPKIQGNFDIGRSWWNDGKHDDYHFNLQLSLSFPLFKGFYYQNQTKSAEALLDKSKAQLYEKELTIIQEVTSAHSEVKSSTESIQYAEEFVQNSELQFDIALKNYKAGVNTIIEVLSAQSSLADARAKLVFSKKEWYSSIANLAFATGALVVNPNQRSQEACNVSF